MNTDYEWQRWNRTFAGEEYYYGDEAGPVARRTVRYARPTLLPDARRPGRRCGEGQGFGLSCRARLPRNGFRVHARRCAQTRQLLAARNLHAEVIERDLRELDTGENYDIVIAINVIHCLGEGRGGLFTRFDGNGGIPAALSG
jgi:hypothetical protein